ncbi:MAG: N-formylglutamate amidohydrolase [Alphaproteobacteria bacterium]
MTFTQLGPNDPPPVKTYLAKHRLILSAEHAGRRTPAALGDLGVSAADQRRHVWYDIGMDVVPMLLRERLGCSLVHSTYSRLVLDPNRHPSDPTAIPLVSDDVRVIGNQDITYAEVAARHQIFHVRYHAALTSACDVISSFDERELGGSPIYLSLHSMTDRLKSVPDERPWEITFLHNDDIRLAENLEHWFKQKGFNTALNQPYDARGSTGFSLYSHGYSRGWLHCALEIRQDLLSTEKGCELWVDHLADALTDLMEKL